MFFFKKPKKESTTQTQPISLLKHILTDTTECGGCRAIVSTLGAEPLADIECPECQTPVLVPKQIKGYWLYRFVSNGGMGAVYKALSEESPSEQFAVKLLPRGRKSDPLLVDCLANEAEVAYLMRDCPSVAPAVEFGQTDEYYFVTEYIDGERLDWCVSRVGRIPEQDTVQIALNLLKADRFMLQQGYLYRDLKPENIILKGRHEPVIVDFGLCISLEDTVLDLDADEINGSPHFMPPERIIGQPETVQSEIYSLGMVMYYALTGRTLYEPGDVQLVAEKYAGRDHDDHLVSTTEHLSRALQTILRKMIRRKPEERYESFDEVTSDLSLCLG